MAVNMTIKDLKEIIKDIPDDTAIIFPYFEDDPDKESIDGFKYVRSAGLLTSPYATEPGLCFTSTDDELVQDQVSCTGATCIKELFGKGLKKWKK